MVNLRFPVMPPAAARLLAAKVLGFFCAFFSDCEGRVGGAATLTGDGGGGGVTGRGGGAGA